MQVNHDTFTDEALNAVELVLSRSVDAGAGFETMTAKAEPEFRPIAERFMALHKRQAATLAGVFSAHGRTPDASGTLMSQVNKAVVSIRAVFDEIDADVMAAVRSGEDHVLDAYEQALQHALPGDVAAQLQALKTELQGLISDTRAVG